MVFHDRTELLALTGNLAGTDTLNRRDKVFTLGDGIGPGEAELLVQRDGRVGHGGLRDEAAVGVLEDVGDDLADATDSVISDYLSIGPVIYVDQGARVTVMVDRDLEIF